jgi:aspartyl-tRNA(Asn)/glutamyl-tRNA(Gln) amidotransferase subunit A
MAEILDLSVWEVASAVAAGDLSAAEVAQTYLEQIEVQELEVGAFLAHDPEIVLARARKLDERRRHGEKLGRLAGVPVAIKDNICTKDWPTTAGSRILEGYRPPYDATVVEKLESDGALVFGKTNLDEFAMGSSTENSAFKLTRNPWDLERVPGGSSGGSAAAVAARMVQLALGSDTGGSIRQPAALCGVVGVKPTYGRVSRYGLIAFGSSLDQIGPLAATVTDAAIACEVLFGKDMRDSTSLDVEVPALREALDAGVSGLKIGLVTELLDAASTEVRQQVLSAAAKLEREGAELKEISIPELVWGLPAYYVVAPAEASSNLARYDGIRYGLRVNGANAEQVMVATRSRGFGPEVKRRIMLGTYVLSAGYYDAFYLKAQRVRTVIKEAFDRAYSGCDLLMSPTSPSVAFRFGERSDPVSMYRSDICTIPSNLAGDPAMSVPFGLSAEKLPIGVQVMGPAMSEPVLFRVARALELLSEEAKA